MLILGRSGQVRECNFPSSIPSRECNDFLTFLALDLIIPFNRRKTFADRSLSTFGPRVRNPLPYEIKSQIDFDKFKKQAKTYLFGKYFSVFY